MLNEGVSPTKQTDNEKQVDKFSKKQQKNKKTTKKQKETGETEDKELEIEETKTQKKMVREVAMMRAVKVNFSLFILIFKENI